MKELKYTDETDRSLGVAGMAIALVACDCESALAEVCIDDDEPLRLAEEFYFSGNPRQSARIAWNEYLRQFRVESALLLGNVLCRHYAAGRRPSDELMTRLHDFIFAEGRDHCELDDDELDRLYQRDLQYHTRLFTHPGVRTVAGDFATLLRMRRRMSAGDVLEQLARLNNI